MANRRRNRRNKLPAEPCEAFIESLTSEGRGLAHIDGKATFIEGALVGETVSFQYTYVSKSHDEGRTLSVLEASPDRVIPRCVHFGVCGGCSLQHLAEEAQIEAKQQAMVENLKRLGKVEPEQVMMPLTGPVWGYRGKARLGVKYVPKKHKVLVGFRERGSGFIADLTGCEILQPVVGRRIEALSEMLMGLHARQRIPQIEVAVADVATALIFRHLDPLCEDDLATLREFGRSHDMQIYLQGGGPESVKPLWPEHPDPLFYELPGQEVRIQFQPNDFTQVNRDINKSMVNRALELLELTADDEVLDLFCGLGNFTLPMAKRVAKVTGVEGDIAMVQKGRENARLNGLDNIEFYADDLSADLTGRPWLNRRYSKVLLDPPRSGAMEMMPYIARLGASKVVYVSCHPATLARDAGILVHEYGYRLKAAGVMDMFPHTAHVESIAVFEKG